MVQAAEYEVVAADKKTYDALDIFAPASIFPFRPSPSTADLSYFTYSTE
jgi:hypothetical protein